MAGRRKKLEAGSGAIKEFSTSEKIDQINAAFFDALMPREILDLDEWADKYRMLPRETSAEYGQWSTDRFPFLRRIMKCMSPSSVAKEIAVMKGSQLGVTETAINTLLYYSVMDPCPIMYCQKTGDSAREFSTQKLAPSIGVTSAVRYTLGDKKSKKLTSAWDNKGFPGGFIAIGGANSEPFIRGTSARIVIADEEDSYDATVGAEERTGGSPISNLRKRSTNFYNTKFLRITTPKIKETSTIEPAYEQGSQEQYYIPCPRCGVSFVMFWEHIKYDKDVINVKTGLPKDVWLECPHCMGRIEEHEKTWMLLNGDWMSEKDSPGQPYVVGDVEYPSFQISSLYSPFGFFGWRDAVKDWFDYKKTKDPALLQVIVNQTWGETWTLTGQDISYSYLHARREKYLAEVPMEALVITAGVDIQKDRIECETVAWGLFDQSWSLDYSVFYGDPEDLGNYQQMNVNGQPTVWLMLDQHLTKTYQHESGRRLGIECTVIDQQYHTDPVNTFCRLREHRRIFPGHGKEGWGRGYYDRPKRRHDRHKTWNFRIYIDEIKNKIYSMLKVDTIGAGYAHFPKTEKYGERYFKGLTAESLKPKYINGKTKMSWYTPPGARNEPLDCRVYAYAGLHVYSPNMEKRAEEYMIPVEIAAPPPVKKRRRGHPGI